MKRLILAILATAWCSLALAQSNFTAPGGQNVPMAVQGCLNASNQAIPCGSSGAIQTTQIVLGTGVTGIATGTTGIVTATLAGTAAKTTYICGFDISAAGTATISPITIGGLLGGTFTFQGISAGVTPFVRTYSPCIPASASNIAITVNTTADGTATAVDVQAWGYQQ